MKNLFEDRPCFTELIAKEDLVGIEIGVDSAETSVRLLSELSIKKLYLIDPYINYGNFSGGGVLEDNSIAERCKRTAEERLKGYENKIVWIIDFAENCVDRLEDNLDFVYLDGNHRYEYIKKDIELYYPKVKSGGMLAGHDYKNNEPGVILAVKESLTELGIETFRQSNWDWWIIKNGK